MLVLTGKQHNNMTLVQRGQAGCSDPGDWVEVGVGGGGMGTKYLSG